MKLANNCFVDKLLLINITCVNKIVMTAELLITQVKLHNLDNGNKLDVSNSDISFCFYYVVMYPENQTYLKKYLKYFSMYLYLNTYAFKSI